MEIKTKLVSLENAGSRYLILAIWLLYNINMVITANQRYDLFITDDYSIAQMYLRALYIYSILGILVVLLLIFFVIVDGTVKHRNKHLILQDGILFIPNSITNKVKEIKLEDIDNIGLEGFTDNKIKINMNNYDYFFAPRLYNVYDSDIKDIYNTLNELLVKDYSNNK